MYVCGGFWVMFDFFISEYLLIDVLVVVGGVYIEEVKKIIVIVWIVDVVWLVRCVVLVCMGVFLLVEVGLLVGWDVIIYWEDCDDL